MNTETEVKAETKAITYAIYFETPVPFGGIRIGKLVKWDKLDLVRFFYTRLDDTPYCLDFENEKHFRRWLEKYLIDSSWSDWNLKLQFTRIPTSS